MTNDADIMRQKQQQALEKKAQAEQNSQSSKIVKVDPLK
jgi:hypothetical protein